MSAVLHGAGRLSVAVPQHLTRGACSRLCPGPHLCAGWRISESLHSFAPSPAGEQWARSHSQNCRCGGRWQHLDGKLRPSLWRTIIDPVERHHGSRSPTIEHHAPCKCACKQGGKGRLWLHLRVFAIARPLRVAAGRAKGHALPTPAENCRIPGHGRSVLLQPVSLMWRHGGVRGWWYYCVTHECGAGSSDFQC